MSSATNIPVTFSTSIGGNGSELFIGKQKYYTNPKTINSFWWTIVDLTDPAGKPLLQATSTSNSEPPPEVVAFADDTNAFLFFSFLGVFASHMPTGNLYEFLKKVGSDRQLDRIEQIVEQAGSNFFDVAGYILAATMDTSDEPGFEMLNWNNTALMTMQFMPVEVDGKVIYAPVQLS